MCTMLHEALLQRVHSASSGTGSSVAVELIPIAERYLTTSDFSNACELLEKVRTGALEYTGRLKDWRDCRLRME